jgi:hypothetical protein
VSTEVRANLLIHPTVGMTKPRGLDHDTRVRCYQAPFAAAPFCHQAMAQARQVSSARWVVGVAGHEVHQAALDEAQGRGCERRSSWRWRPVPAAPS